jgi:hypothetical protein
MKISKELADEINDLKNPQVPRSYDGGVLELVWEFADCRVRTLATQRNLDDLIRQYRTILDRLIEIDEEATR